MSEALQPTPDRAADDKLAMALAGGKAIAEAAAEAGISERTAYRRLKSVAFRRKLEGLRTEALERGVNRLAQFYAEAVEELCRLCREGTKEDAQKIHAIRLLLETTHEGAKLVDLQARLKALEAKKKHAGRNKLPGVANREAGTGGRGAGADGRGPVGGDPAAADGDFSPSGFDPRPFPGAGFDFSGEANSPELLSSMG